MGKYTIFYLFENPKRGMQARSVTTNVPKILDLKSSSEQIFSRKLSLGAPDLCDFIGTKREKSSTPTGLVWDTNMAAVSLFWNTNMASVMSCENTLLKCFFVVL